MPPLNTGPLIRLGRAGALEILAELPIRFLTPLAAVEIEAGARQGHPIEVPQRVEVIPLQRPPSPLVVQSLDAGEAAVIRWLLSRACRRHRRMRDRRIAKAAGLEATGSLGLLGRAKAGGLVPELKPRIARLAARFDGLLIQKFLKTFGEE